MNCFLFNFVLVLALGQLCLAIDVEKIKEEHKEFYKQTTDAICNKDKTTDEVLKNLLVCNQQLKGDVTPEQIEKCTKMNEECDKGRDADISGFTKVDLKNMKNRYLLLLACSEEFKKCRKTKWMEARKAAGDKKEHKMADKDKFEAYKTCAKKALSM